MSFNYLTNGDYEIDNSKMIEGFGFSDNSGIVYNNIHWDFDEMSEDPDQNKYYKIDNEKNIEGFADHEDPYIERKLPCISGVSGVEHECKDDILTMPKSTFEGIVELKDKIESNKSKYNNKKREDFTGDELEKYDDYIENIDRYNDECKIITDWNNNIPKESDNESTEESVEEESEYQINLNETTDRIISETNQELTNLNNEKIQIQNELSELEKNLLSLENEEKKIELENEINNETTERFSLLEDFMNNKGKYNKKGRYNKKESLDRINKRKKMYLEKIKEKKKELEGIKKKEELIKQHGKEDIRREIEQAKEKKEVEQNYSTADTTQEPDDDKNDVLDNYYFAGGIIAIVLIILFLLYFALR